MTLCSRCKNTLIILLQEVKMTNKVVRKKHSFDECLSDKLKILKQKPNKRSG